MEASSYKPTHEKPPARTLGFLSNQMVTRCGIDLGLRMSYPARHLLVNLVVIPYIDWNDFILGNDEFKSNSVFQVDRDAVQTVKFPLKTMKSQRRVMRVYR